MKRLFFVMSVTAMANLAALAGLAAVGWQRGWLAPQRVRDALAVLRGEPPVAPATSMPTTAPVEIMPASVRIAENTSADRVREAELARRQQEIEQGWSRLETQQLAFLRMKEDFEAARKREKAEAAARTKTGGDSGWQKELDLIGSMKPKMAKDVLREKPDAETVRAFSELEPRKAQKIIEQCKTAEERQWIGRILDQLHQRDATQAEALGAGKTTRNPGA